MYGQQFLVMLSPIAPANSTPLPESALYNSLIISNSSLTFVSQEQSIPRPWQ